MKNINTFNKLFVPNIEPGTKTFEEIRLDWAIGLIAMEDLETETGMTMQQANEERYNLLNKYIADLHQASDYAQQNRSMVALYWENTIKQARSLTTDLSRLNSGLDADYISNTVDHLKHQRDIELSMLRFG